jgi:Cd2+/Zn2+-exporting ATPase
MNSCSIDTLKICICLNNDESKALWPILPALGAANLSQQNESDANIMTLHTITLARPQVLPQNTDCDCCAGHVLDALRGRAGVAEARLNDSALTLEIDAQVVGDAEAEQLARDAGASVVRRYDHPVFAVEGMDCADCARTLERGVARLQGVHYANVNFAVAKLRLEYDREQTSAEAITALARRLGYTLHLPGQLTSAATQAAPSTTQYTCLVDGMCCAAEAGPIELAVRGLPGVQHVAADPALARLTVRYDPQVMNADGIVAQVEQLGFRVSEDQGRRTKDEGSDHSSLVSRLSSLVKSRPKDILTLVCGLLIVLAWAGELLGMPAGMTVGLYVLATLAGGMFVARNGWATLRATRTMDINLLMTVAAIGALVIGEYAEGAAVVFLFALGNALEGYTMDRARRSIRALLNLAPATALVLRPRNETSRQGNMAIGSEAFSLSPHLLSPSSGYHEVSVPIEQVAVGETIVIRAGDRVPLDALVLAGESAVDQAPITGESMPVAKAAGADLFSGSINGEGALEARVTRVARDSTLARIIHMVEEAQSRKSQAQRFIDVFAKYYTPAVIALALLVFVLPPLAFGGDWGTWFYRALVLLVIACPCALVISTPVSIVSAISAAARAGVLFKGGAALEAAGGLKAIAFDKTGTLTAGRPVVTDVIENEELRIENDPSSTQFSILNSQFSILQLAAAVEHRSTHPLARAIVLAAEQRGLDIPPATGFQSRGGRGATALVDGQLVAIGNRAMFEDQQLPIELEATMHELEQAGRTAMLVSCAGVIHGIIAVADQARPESGAALVALKRQGIAHVAMLTGDAAAVAARVAGEVGVNEVRAELLPSQKLAAIDELIVRHGSVGMVGDGVNDAPALARATVGIAMGVAGSDAAIETADVTLMADDLARLPFAIGLSRAARNIIIQNIVFALVVKAIFLAATLLGVATLWMAVFADTGAALLVIANGMRLLRYRS